MNEKSILNKVRTLLGLEVKLETMRLTDGVSMLEAEVFEAGQPVFILTEDEQRIALPVGDYELEDGRILVVIEEGIIADIREAAEEVEEEMLVLSLDKLVENLRNIGSDMTPEVREQAQQVVIASIIVSQIAITAVGRKP